MQQHVQTVPVVRQAIFVLLQVVYRLVLQTVEMDTTVYPEHVYPEQRDRLLAQIIPAQ